MKKLYIQPATKAAVCLPQTSVLLLGSESGPEPKAAPLRGFEGSTQGLKYLI